jgi:hypothetical protein
MQVNAIEINDLVKIEELEPKSAPAALVSGHPIIKPTTIVWDSL